MSNEKPLIKNVSRVKQTKEVAIVWFRNDLRLSDNPAVLRALRAGYYVLPVFIMETLAENQWPLGGASKWWLHHALADFSEQIAEKKGSLVLRQGDPVFVLQQLIAESGATALYYNQRYEPAGRANDANITEQLSAQGILVETFNGHMLNDPESLMTQQGTPYKVFTPFWRAASVHAFEQPHSSKGISWQWCSSDESLALDQLELLPRLNWADAMADYWEPSRKAALRYFRDFLRTDISVYEDQRNIPGIAGTSFLSPYLHFGQVGVRELVALAQQIQPANETAKASIHCYVKELGWRDFASYLLYHFPHTTNEPLNEKFKHFPWQEDKELIAAWQQGRTGYPIIDAGMRELWANGWMHNRVRMIVSSFLVKHLLQPWQVGAHWFWDTLVAADLASNTMGWQWRGGCGADAAPYVRIVNPESTGQKC